MQALSEPDEEHMMRLRPQDAWHSSSFGFVLLRVASRLEGGALVEGP